MIMGEYLLSLGHRHFAFFSTPFQNVSLARYQRLEGLKQALREIGAEENLHIYTGDYKSESDLNTTSYEYEVGYTLTKKFLDSKDPATALIGVNDMTALGISCCLIERGKKVPKEYSVCGFDNIFVSSIAIPSLTTIEHHLYLRGQSAVDMILCKQPDRTKDISSLKIAPQVNKIEYAPELIIRNSTGAGPGI